MHTLIAARELNALIQSYVESRALDGYVWHSPVYLLRSAADGCNWNVEVNCNDDVAHCGAVISTYLDELRRHYVIRPDDADAVPAYESNHQQHRS